ncbi:hypothetical protein ABFX02_07G107600 [Erythranthe guttata]
MKIKIVSKKLIKPSTPTPQNLSKYKISFIDELMPPVNTRTVLFYYPILSNYRKQNDSSQLLQLAESLSEILPKFYPLAGRYIKNDGFVDCSDHGVEFVEAQVVDDAVDFDDLVSKMGMEELNNLLSGQIHQIDESLTEPLMSIHVTTFKCGGLSIGVSVSHRIFDAYSLGIFINAWSNANHPNPGGEIKIIWPRFDLATLFPGYGPSSGPSVVRSSSPPSPIVKRFSFNKDAITSAGSKLIQRPNSYYSRVRVVCAVIAKALTGVDRAKHGGKSRPCLIVQAVNMRGRTNPPMHKYSCGNFATYSLTYIEDDCKNIFGVQVLADNMGDSVEKTVTSCAQILSQRAKLHSTITETFANVGRKTSSSEVNVMYFTDWSKFGLYDVDFGWGKPVGAAIGAMLGENVVKLMGNKEGDGIEAWVHLNFNDMAYFEQDQDIKLLAT